MREVIADLDISKLTSDVPSDPIDLAYPRNPMSSPASNGQNNHEILSPSEAAAYMQQVIAAKLKNWQDSLDKSISEKLAIRTTGSGPHGSRTVIVEGLGNH